MSSSIDELQRLSLVSKVCTELDNHLGLSDRTLAEFIIHLADDFPEPAAFRHALSENGAEFPDSLSDNLLRIIGAMKPSNGGSKSSRAEAKRSAAPRVPRNEKEARFPGLAMPNTTVVELEEGFREVSEADRKREEEAAAAAVTVAAAMKAKQAKQAQAAAAKAKEAEVAATAAARRDEDEEKGSGGDNDAALSRTRDEEGGRGAEAGEGRGERREEQTRKRNRCRYTFIYASCCCLAHATSLPSSVIAQQQLLLSLLLIS